MDPTDRALIDATLAGELSSYDQLMRRYERLVYRISLFYGRTRENAMDISQNVFLKCYRSLPSFRGDSAFKTWLLRIACNEGLAWVRAGGRRSAHETPGAGMPIVREESTEALQEKEILDMERKSMLVEKLGELNPRQRTAVTLRYLQQRPVREIAEALQCSEGNVKNMLFRSVRKLRDALQQSGIEEWT